MLSRILSRITALLFFRPGDEPPAEEAEKPLSGTTTFAAGLDHFRAKDYAASAEIFERILEDLKGSQDGEVWKETRQYLVLSHIYLNRLDRARQLLADSEQEPPKSLKEKLVDGLQERRDALLSHWRVGVLFLVLVLVVLPSEFFEQRWWQSVASWLAGIWQHIRINYPVTVIIVLIGLLLLIFGLRWILHLGPWSIEFWRWFNRRLLVNSAVLLILVYFVFSIVISANSWSFNTVEVWSDDDSAPKAEDIKVIFRTSLSSVGQAPFASIPARRPAEPPMITHALETFEPLSPEQFEQCQTWLLEQAVPFAQDSERDVISVPPLTTVTDAGRTTDPLSLPTAVGTFDLPLDNLTRMFYRFLPGYRELNTLVSPVPQRPGYVRLVVVSSPKIQRWVVEGPQEAIPQLIDFLAARIALDWKFDQTNQPSDQIDDHQLAFFMGNQAYEAGDFDKAAVFYELAAFYNLTEPIQLMIGLTPLQRSKGEADSSPTGRTLEILRQVKQAASDRQIVQILTPYLACIYLQQHERDMAETAIEDFNGDLVQEEAQAAAPQTETRMPIVRTLALDSLPELGQGQKLSVFAPEIEGGEDGPATLDIYYVAGQRVSQHGDRNAGQIDYGNPLLEPKEFVLEDKPRQLLAVDGGFFRLTGDGLVNFHPHSEITATAVITTGHLRIEAESAQALTLAEFQVAEPAQVAPSTPLTATTLNMGGVRRIELIRLDGREFMLILDRFGRIHRMTLAANEDRTLFQAARQNVLLNTEAQQIIVDQQTLYFLRNDGTVWSVPAGFTAGVTASPVLASTGNRQLAILNGTVYTLRDDDSIWRFRADAAEPLIQIEREGSDIRQIAVSNSGLFILKNNGKIWQVTNPIAPSPDDYHELDSQENSGRLEIFVYKDLVFALDEVEDRRQVVSFRGIPSSASGS